MKKGIIDCLLIIIAITLLSLGLIYLNKTFNIEDSLPSIFDYEVQKKGDYTVNLKPNDFYQNTKLGKGLYYPSKGIDLIDIKFKYFLKGNKNADINYSYNIATDLICTGSNSEDLGKEILDYKEYFSGDDLKVKDTNKFVIEKTLGIDYEKYSNLANDFEKTYNIPISSKLLIKLQVRFNIDSEIQNNETVEDNIEIEIPITDTVTEVKENFCETSESKIFSKNKKETKILYAIIGTTNLVVGLIIAVFVYKKNIKNKSNKDFSKYILNYYKELIVKVKDEPDISNLKVIYIEKVEDLINLVNQNNSNIIYYKDDKVEKFYVLLNEYVFMYVN